MIKKETIEDIDIMDGIDFKTNQKKVREENKKKDLELRILLGLYVFVVILLILIIAVIKGG